MAVQKFGKCSNAEFDKLLDAQSKIMSDALDDAFLEAKRALKKGTSVSAVFVALDHVVLDASDNFRFNVNNFILSCNGPIGESWDAKVVQCLQQSSLQFSERFASLKSVVSKK